MSGRTTRRVRESVKVSSHTMMVWVQFLVCTVVIMFAGAKLSKYGDIIAEKTGLGRTWIGVILMASVTSLPELITGVSSVAVFSLPDIAAGDVLGSCMFNILILAILDFVAGEKPLSVRADQGQVLTAGFGMLLLGLASMAMITKERLPAIGWFGVYSPVILLVYLGSMRAIFQYERRRRADSVAKELKYEQISKSRAFTMYGINALLVIGAATWLPQLGEKIAEITGLGESFVGNLFIAASTSLPEVVVTYSAIRRGAVDLAYGNLFGSNLFNVGILALDDFAFMKGPLLSHVADGQIISALGAIIMTAIAIIGLTYRAQEKPLRLDSIANIVVFAVAMFLAYLFGNAPG